MSDGFLSRWARRKRDVRLSEQAEIPLVEADLVDHPPVQLDETVASDAAAEAEHELLAELPSLEDLTAETDLTPFLRTGVPSAMRNAALRKMWSVDPAIRDFVSEAREYAYDWNTPGGVPGLGPLLPVDDVKAMLSRLFNRDPSDEVETAADRLDEAPHVGATNEDPTAGVSGGEFVSTESGEPHQAALEANVPDRDDAANSPKRPSATPNTTVTVSRLRRHGGAMPS